MKNKLLKLAFATIAFFQSASYVIAQDYSGRHYTDDSTGSSGFGFVIFVLLVAAGFIIYGVIQSNSNKPKHNTTQPSSSGYKPITVDDIRRQDAEDLQRKIDYLKQKDKEGEAALKGCMWTIITIAVLALISYCSNH